MIEVICVCMVNYYYQNIVKLNFNQKKMKNNPILQDTALAPESEKRVHSVLDMNDHGLGTRTRTTLEEYGATWKQLQKLS